MRTNGARRVAGEQRSRLSGEEAAAAGGADEAAGEEGYLDAKQRGLDDAAERRLVQIMRDYQHEINNYETLQKGKRDRHPRNAVYSLTRSRITRELSIAEEAISKTAKVLEEADISEEKRDVIHREIGKFRESMKVTRETSAGCRRPRPPRPAGHSPRLCSLGRGGEAECARSSPWR